MNSPDLINGAFEAVGSIAIWSNVGALYRDKQVKGYRWISALFFAGWGLWNMFYYPHLNQWLSTLGGSSLAAANVVYLLLMTYYVRRNNAQ